MSQVHALVPVKSLSDAKSRLAPHFDPAARRELMEKCARHVLRTLAASAVESLTVLTQDDTVAAFGKAHGAGLMAELPGETLNEALDRAAATLGNAGRDLILVLPADLPLLDQGSVQALVNAAGASRAVIVPSRRDGGTNALISPASSFGYAFGPGSAARHEKRAVQAGLNVTKLSLVRIELDLDTPEDIKLIQAAEYL